MNSKILISKNLPSLFLRTAHLMINDTYRMLLHLYILQKIFFYLSFLKFINIIELKISISLNLPSAFFCRKLVFRYYNLNVWNPKHCHFQKQCVMGWIKKNKPKNYEATSRGFLVSKTKCLFIKYVAIGIYFGCWISADIIQSWKKLRD